MNLLLMRWAAIVAFVISSFLSYSAYGLHQQFAKKIAEQEAVNKGLVSFKASYTALLPVNDRFTNAYPQIAEIHDLISLYSLLELEKTKMQSYRDDLTYNGTTLLASNDIDIKLKKDCLGNGGAGLHVSANSVPELFAGLLEFTDQQRIQFSSLEISSITPPKVDAYMNNFCLISRASDDVQMRDPSKAKSGDKK